MDPKIRTRKAAALDVSGAASGARAADRPTLHSVVVPVFNEKDGLRELVDRLRALMASLAPDEVEVLFVDDGSSDGSEDALDEACERDPRLKVLHLSRNFGHQIAITAGIRWARGDTVSVMDADLQDPPELLREMIARWREGFDVVYAVRRTRAGESPFKLWTASAFYRLIRRMTQIDIPPDTGDFRLMDAQVAEAFRQLPERHRFVRGMVAWLGYRQTGVLYDRAERAHGETHYPLRKMVRLAADAITSFSIRPLQMASYVGLASSLLAVAAAIWTLYVRLWTDAAVQGWTSTMLVCLFLGGAQLLALGVFGEYLGRIHEEVKGRPLFLVSRAKGFERARGIPSGLSRPEEGGADERTVA